ncbi:MAG: hypothetical protein M3019_03375 [Candidatus Dormibacteraeota bacterium]|nr:hypothetical protein [Candidatus Dormibacteraeota bacterium]
MTLPVLQMKSANASSGFVQSFGAATATGSATLSTSPQTATTAGDLLVATIRDRNLTTPAAIVSVTDSASNVWVRAASVAQGQAVEEIWYVANAARISTAQSVTVTVGGTSASSSAIAFTVIEAAGDASTTRDVSATASGTGTAASTGTTGATSQASEIAIGDVGWNGASTPSAQAAGYTPTAVEQAKVSGGQAGEQAAWQVLSATGAQSYGAKLSSSVAWTGAIATFKLATGPTPTPTGTPTATATATPTPPPTGADWPEYLHDPLGSGFTRETLVNPSNAAALKPQKGWPVALTNGAVCPSAQDTCSNMIFSQPIVATVSGTTLVYAGSWNGSEFALCAAAACTVGSTTYSNGQVVWSTYVGRTSGCGGPQMSAVQGVTSAAAVATVAVNGVSQPVVFVGGGGDIAQSGAVTPGATSQYLALNALTGAVLWHTSLGSAPASYSWSSPLFANGSLYVGISSLSDCPLVQGGLAQLDPATGTVRHSFATVPSGCLGGSIWGSPTSDTAGNVYVATGNPGGGCRSSEPYAPAVLELSPTLALAGSWQLPVAEQGPDSDFGSTPTMFTGTVTPGGTLLALLGVANKNGIYYVFQQGNVGAGPLQRVRVANGTGGFKGSISPSSWDGSRLYIAGGNTSINGTAYVGSLRAFDPNNLAAPLWQVGFTSGAAVGAVASDPGLAMVGHARVETIVNTQSGAVLLNATAASGGSFWGAASIAHGVIYVGDTTGILHAYSVNGV